MILPNVQHLPINVTPTNLNNLSPGALRAPHQRHPAVERQAQERQRCLTRLLQRLAQSESADKGHVEDFLRQKYRQNCKANTLLAIYTSISAFMGFILSRDKTTLSEVTRQDVEAYLEAEQDRGLKITTVSLRLINLRSFFAYLIEQSVMEETVLAKKIRLQLPDALPRAIDAPNIQQLLAVISSVRDRALILLLLRTGMRVGELLGTQMSDINLHDQKIMIYEAHKTGIGRVVYFSDDARLALQKWLQERDARQPYLFYSKRNPMLTYAAARCVFMKLVKRAGLSGQGYTLHRLRHSFASELLNAGMRLECLQPLLGHACIEMTRRYARLTDKRREQEYFSAMQRIERGEIDGD
jgi:site-specific recombinase XerD